jgi:hypothetical protein
MSDAIKAPNGIPATTGLAGDPGSAFSPQTNVSAQIEAMVARRAGQAVNLGHPSNNTTDDSGRQESIRYNSRTGETEATGINPDARVPDDGRDLLADARIISARSSDIASKLAAHTFDPTTGAKVMSLPIGSEVRRLAEVEMVQLMRSHAYQISVAEKLQIQRAAEEIKTERVNTEDAERMNFTRGNPERTKLLNDEIERARAAAIAKRIVDRENGNAQ